MLKSCLALLALAAFSGSAVAQSNPSAQQTEAFRNRPCADPWINLAFLSPATGGSNAPNGEFSTCECNPKLYNNGSWASYADLVEYVKQYKRSGVRLNYFKMQDGTYVVQALHNGSALGVSRLNANGDVLASGGSAVAAGGLGVQNAGPRNVVSNSGNLIGVINGGTLRNVFPGQPGFSFSSGGNVSVRTSGAGQLSVQ
ncbi:hypothetical protein [Hymenobacter pini]|uniref:hypothetical protein n=1 Tax=Hymenobacter pini TaxID=2880879 RepID=UPI001CF146E1|nr:hypothetical protein [Hymenobacter pini]MCA8833224.1 hypothetical protein [Hymenobacter pini]